MANQTPPPAPTAPSALNGWTALQQAVNVSLPEQLAQAEAVRAATARILGRG